VAIAESVPSIHTANPLPPASDALAVDEVTVIAPARLHMGFLDLAGTLGRKFGSIGVGINEIATVLTLSSADRLSAEGADAGRALAAAVKFSREVGRSCPAAIRIHRAIPHHAGLGSGTQLSLAVCAGLASLLGLALSVHQIAAIADRGARSGIGIAVFEQGGLVVDGGRGSRTVVPPVVARLAFPDAWRFILILDRRDKGLHGPAEIEAFRALPEFPIDLAASLSHQLLMRGLPALVEQDIENFGAVITELQAAVGDHFSPAQGGRFGSRDVAEALEFLSERGAVGLGQSSWGPTGFCLSSTAEASELLARLARDHFSDRPYLDFVVGSARNRGAEIFRGPGV
jgi:beta-RFAP synthase